MPSPETGGAPGEHRATCAGCGLVCDDITAVVGEAPQQAHRRVRVDVDEARQHGVLRQRQRLARPVRLPREIGGQHVDDAAVADDERVILQYGASRLDGHEPARQDQQVGVLHFAQGDGR
jgi:formylmethanofuran dehydrogenase subunit B